MFLTSIYKQRAFKYYDHNLFDLSSSVTDYDIKEYYKQDLKWGETATFNKIKK